LISKWIKYDDKLNKLPSLKISVEKNSKEMFHYFKIVPKLCDSMMFCRRANIVVEPLKESEDIEQTLTFEFINLKESLDYVKLMFEIEYFLPKSSSEHSKDIKFKLELLNFGDPCFKNGCPTDSPCLSHPQKVLPDKPECECDTRFTGDKCDNVNWCEYRVSIIHVY
jgi:hypothetical protein